ncbi:uncharacterized protein LOC110807026 [Carica papaya]|uniref:uncharacterized protein LOC110807026 n=1 Tax=Carica papaya TaxID=3649 RepID=UPI000B8D18F3|nr:uncharacterized protein LOC110807026 [Carica papaya]
MAFGVFTSLLHRFSSRWPLLLYAAMWTILLTAAVVLASFSPELAYASALLPSSYFSRSCERDGFIRVPLEVGGEIVCLPASMVGRSKLDWIVPPIFAAVIVAGSAWAVRAMCPWEID